MSPHAWFAWTVAAYGCAVLMFFTAQRREWGNCVTGGIILLALLAVLVVTEAHL